MIKFANAYYLYFLILIPIFVGAYIYMLRKRKNALDSFGEVSLIEQLAPEVHRFRPIIKFSLFLLAFTAWIFVLARPQMGSKLQQVKRKGIELMICLDVSNSMLAQDYAPNRLEKAKQAVSRIVDKLQDDKVGLIVFAGEAYTQMPITTDYASAKLFLSTINPGMVPSQGTAIGEAIGLAMNSFGPESSASRAIIVITDGENHESDAEEMAAKAKEKGITIHTIGIGDPQGVPIPIGETGAFLKDNSGNVVVTKLDEETLKKIATVGGGIYMRSANTSSGINALFNEIDKMQKAEIDSRVYSEYEEQFQWIAWITLVLLMAELYLLERRNKYLSKIKLFK